ncbi:hypothetical protein ACFLZS_01365 [Patescibacteria group bacterium]
MLKILRQNKGQSLVETLIAIGVIVVGLVGVMALVVSAVAAGRISKEIVTATNLGREGIEVVREIRDSNWMQEESWTKEIIGGGNVRYARANFNAKKNQWELESATSTDLFDNEYKLYFSDYYSHDSSGDETSYYRMIEIQKDIAEADQLIIKSHIGWLEQGKEKEIILEDVLTDWLTTREVE